MFRKVSISAMLPSLRSQLYMHSLLSSEHAGLAELVHGMGLPQGVGSDVSVAVDGVDPAPSKSPPSARNTPPPLAFMPLLICELPALLDVWPVVDQFGP